MTSHGARAVIFDMDGVLIDSFLPHFISWRDTLAPHGLVLTETDFLLTFGKTSRETIGTLWPEVVLSDEVRQQIDLHKELLFRELITSDFPAMEGAVELIRALRSAGWIVAVGSSGPPENVRFTIERLGIAGDLGAAVHGKDVLRGKPDPAIFLLAAERVRVSPSRCIVIEDSPVGICAALAAGMRCVGLVSTGHTHEQLKDAHLRVDTFAELNPSRLAELLESR